MNIKMALDDDLPLEKTITNHYYYKMFLEKYSTN